MATVTMTVNGQTATREVEPRTLLVEFLRQHLGLTGTHVGCDTSQCGACVVHIGGRSVKSCTLLALQADGTEVTTEKCVDYRYDSGVTTVPVFEENLAKVVADLQEGFDLVFRTARS